MNNTNPCHLNGFSFLEFSSQTPDDMRQNFKNLGFLLVARHTRFPIEIWQQGEISFVLNQLDNCQAQHHAQIHQSGACAMGFHTHDRHKAHQTAIERGAKAANPHPIYDLPSIQGIGGSVIYFTDTAFQLFEHQWEIYHHGPAEGAGLEFIDHLTHNVHRGQLKVWSDFYHTIFGFKEIRDFNIQGQHTGLYSQALASPCGKIKIPLNESKDEHSQIEEFLQEYHGEGIQHIALHTSNIYHTVDKIHEMGIMFLNTPDTYFDMIMQRLPWQDEPLAMLQKLKILIDGGPKKADGVLLQIFTENLFGPVFFEIIQRKGHSGFGEGNFQALFEAIERDQMLRGKLEKA
jgi:4-hydroxyphenylpyruvate dioxygenase